jgi:hypothetical protein
MTMGDAALLSKGYQDSNAAQLIRIEIPGNVWYRTGLIVDSNTNLGRVLNSIPTTSSNGDFYVSRIAGMRAENGYKVKFEYQVNYGKWQTAEGWTTSKTSNPNVEKINVPDGWKPNGTTGLAYYSFNIRVTLIDPRGNAVQSNAPAVAWTVHDKSPHANALGEAGQTQTASVLAHNQADSATEMSLSDRFFVALAHKNRPDGLPIITAGNWGV